MLYYISKIRIRPYRLAVRTAPSHGANSGSSPDKVTKKEQDTKTVPCSFLANLFKIRRSRRVRASKLCLRRSPENAYIFFGAYTKGALLRVSEFPAERFDLAWLSLTTNATQQGGFFILH